jgi:2-amino-4-hydroxy-6-hydroxymethyldihydropteridine diphosphokinase
MGTAAYLGLGSNLGDRLANLQRAVDLLAAHPAIEVRRSSRVYETEPVGGPPQPDYLNAVVEVDTQLGPHQLLEACLDVEGQMGRIRAERWGPRVIDVDLLIYDEREIEEPDLVVPHPRMRERAFVLMPLTELQPDPALGRGRRLSTLRLGPSAMLGVRPFAPPLRVPA